MSIIVNGQSKVPPGFRFHPTEEELLNYYLRKKLACEKIDLDVIRDVDLNKLEPWDIQEKCRIGSTPQNDWYFFSHKDKKYPTGTRTNRATTVGFWKATGRDKVIYTSLKRIGMRKTLVFYMGRAPHGQKSDWIMHEYRFDDHHNTATQAGCCSIGEVMGQEDGWVVCRVFKQKKYYHKALVGPTNNSSSTATSISDGKAQMLHSGNDRALDHIFNYRGRSCNKKEINNPTTTNINYNNSSDDYLKCVLPTEIVASTGAGQLERFMKLPGLESPSLVTTDCAPANQIQPVLQQTDWTVLDRLVASHLNGHTDTIYGSFGPQKSIQTPQDYGHSGDSDMDLWAFARSGSSNSESEHHFHMSG